MSGSLLVLSIASVNVCTARRCDIDKRFAAFGACVGQLCHRVERRPYGRHGMVEQFGAAFGRHGSAAREALPLAATL